MDAVKEREKEKERECMSEKEDKEKIRSRNKREKLKSKNIQSTTKAYTQQFTSCGTFFDVSLHTLLQEIPQII